FIANAEEKRKESLERRMESTVGRRVDVQRFKKVLSA
ncbi:hypothetical protein P3T16_002214, partial [Paraburkholderia sp. GAS42]